MRPLIENSPVSGYDDLVGLWDAAFYTAAFFILIGGFILAPIAERMKAKNVRVVAEARNGSDRH